MPSRRQPPRQPLKPHQGIFYLCGGDALTADIHHVIHPPLDNNPLTNPYRAIVGGIAPLSLPIRPVVLVVLDIILPQRRHPAGAKRIVNHKHARLARRAGFPAGGMNHLSRAREYRRERSTGAGQQRPAGFGLPVMVLAGHPQLCGHPLIGGVIQRLAGEIERAQRGQIGARLTLPPGHANRPGNGQHPGDAEGFHHLPPVFSRRVNLAEHRRQPRQQRPIDPVAVPGHPAGVGGCKENLVVPQPKEMHKAGQQRHGVTARVADDPFGVPVVPDVNSRCEGAEAASQVQARRCHDVVPTALQMPGCTYLLPAVRPPAASSAGR